MSAEARLSLRRPRPAAGVSLNLTSMIDVTFLLLVYFMTVTQFRTGEEVYRLDLPERAEGRDQPSDPFQLDDEPLRIEVAGMGGADAGVRIRIDGPWPQPTGTAGLHDFLRSRRIGAPGSIGLFAADHPIIVHPTGATAWQHALEAFDAAARAGYSNITLQPPS